MKDAGVPLPEGFETVLSDFYKGLKRKDASQRQDGTRRATEGKEPMPFELYEWLAKYFLKEGQMFAWLYLVVCWNIMSRTQNAAGICLSHLSWMGDCLGLVIPKSKSDQGSLSFRTLYIFLMTEGGEKPKDPFHIYANPYNLAISPIAALGVWLLTHENFIGEKLFLGGLFPFL